MSSNIVNSILLDQNQFNIKWQTFGLVSLVLALLVALFLLMLTSWSESHFEDERLQAHNEYEQQLSRLIESSANKMIQLSSAVSLNSTLMEAMRENNSNLVLSELDALDWNLQADAGLSVAGLFGKNSEAFMQNEGLSKVNVVRVLYEEKPIWQLDCSGPCRVLTYTALLFEGEVLGALVLDEPLSHVLLRFKHAANIDSGLLSADVGTSDRQPIISPWQRALVALTSPHKSQDVIDRASEAYSLEELSTKARLVDLNENLYELKAISIQDQSQLLVISNVSDTYSKHEASKDKRFQYSLVALVIAEAMLLLFLWRPLSKVRVGETLVDYVVEQADQLKLRTEAMLSAQSFSESVCDTVDAAILVIDENRQIRSVNAYLRQTLAMPTEQLLGRRFESLLCGNNAYVVDRINDVASGILGSYEHVAVVQSSNGATHRMLWRIASIYHFEQDYGELDGNSDGESSLMVVGMPLTVPAPMDAQNWIADHDATTGLLNREGFYRKLERSFVSGEICNTEIIVCRIELVEPGHAAKTARVFAQTVNECNAYCAVKAASRIDVNEFALWLDKSQKFELGTQAQRLFDRLVNDVPSRLGFDVKMVMGFTLVRSTDRLPYQVVQRAAANAS